MTCEVIVKKLTSAANQIAKLQRMAIVQHEITSRMDNSMTEMVENSLIQIEDQPVSTLSSLTQKARSKKHTFSGSGSRHQNEQARAEGSSNRVSFSGSVDYQKDSRPCVLSPPAEDHVLIPSDERDKIEPTTGAPRNIVEGNIARRRVWGREGSWFDMETPSPFSSIGEGSTITCDSRVPISMRCLAKDIQPTTSRFINISDPFLSHREAVSNGLTSHDASLVRTERRLVQAQEVSPKLTTTSWPEPHQSRENDSSQERDRLQRQAQRTEIRLLGKKDPGCDRKRKSEADGEGTGEHQKPIATLLRFAEGGKSVLAGSVGAHLLRLLMAKRHFSMVALSAALGMLLVMHTMGIAPGCLISLIGLMSVLLSQRH